jgi:hypothetical protein
MLEVLSDFVPVTWFQTWKLNLISWSIFLLWIFIVKDLLYSKTSVIWILYSFDCHIIMIINIQHINYGLLFKRSILFILSWILCFVLNRNIFINFSLYSRPICVPESLKSIYISGLWIKFANFLLITTLKWLCIIMFCNSGYTLFLVLAQITGVVLYFYISRHKMKIILYIWRIKYF